MNRRIFIIGTVVLALAVSLFLAKPPKLPQQNAVPYVPKTHTVAEPNNSRPETQNAAPNGAPAAPNLPPATTSNLTVAPEAPPASPMVSNQPVNVGAKTVAPNVPPPARDPEAETDVDKVRLMLRDYRTLYHENPVGTNADIMKAVMGGNPKGARLGPPEGQSLSGAGALLDRWGTPYFFHQLSANSMEIRSAGADKVLWTSDDVVAK